MLVTFLSNNLSVNYYKLLHEHSCKVNKYISSYFFTIVNSLSNMDLPLLINSESTCIKFVTNSTPICLKYSKCTFHLLSKMHQFKLPPLVRILFNLHWYLHIFTRDPLLRHTSWHHTTAPELYTIYKHRYTCTINKSSRKTKHRNLHERKSIHKHWHCMYT